MIEALSQPRRRLLRFSLRGLLLSIFVVALLLSWTIHDARQQGLAVAALREMGCNIGYNYGPSLTFQERLRELLGEENPGNVVRVCSPSITEDAVAHLQRLPHLKVLYVVGTGVSDAGLVHLQGLTGLKTLHLFSTRVTDAGVQKLQAALPNCKISR